MGALIPYASRTGTKRNLDMLRARGWRLLEVLGEWIWDQVMSDETHAAWQYLQVVRIYESSTTWCEVHRSEYTASWMARR